MQGQNFGIVPERNFDVLTIIRISQASSKLNIVANSLISDCFISDYPIAII